jgi:hypothetical protein
MIFSFFFASEMRKKTVGGMEMGPDNLHVFIIFSRSLCHPFNCFASFLLCGDMHMNMTQQEAIKISNLIAEKFLPVFEWGGSETGTEGG